jgi:biotin operon repressor
VLIEGHTTKKTYYVLTDLSQSDRVASGNKMPYERSQAHEERLSLLLQLLQNSAPSSKTLAHSLDVSLPTLSRCLKALRQRGYAIKAVKHESGWSYRLTSSKSSSTGKR